MGNFCSFGPPNEPSPPPTRRVKPGTSTEVEPQPDNLSVVTTVPTVPINTSTSSVVPSSNTKSLTSTSTEIKEVVVAPVVVVPPTNTTATTTNITAPSVVAPPTTSARNNITTATLAVEAEITIKSTSSETVVATQPPVETKTSKTCAKCNKTITGTMIEAMNKEYHEVCFVCASCKGELAGRFAVIDGSPYCPTCAVTANKNRKGSAIKTGPTETRPASGGSKIQTGQMGLLQWCKNRTQDYQGVEVRDFVKSWQDGLAYCALLHSYRPDLLDFNSLSATNKEKNIAIAFEAAAKMEIPELLDPEDFALEKLSMMTYLSAIYEKLAKVKVNQ